MAKKQPGHVRLDDLRSGLNHLRVEWQEIADLEGIPIESIQASVGYLLADVEKIVDECEDD